jgi:carboxylesterase
MSLFTHESLPTQWVSGHKTAVLLIHGFSSTPRELNPLAKQLHHAGYDAFVPLLPYHRQDLATFAQFKWEDCLDDMLVKLAELRASYQSVHVVGLSFGALLALHLSLKIKVESLILLAPYLFPAGHAHKLKQWLVPLLPTKHLLAKKSNAALADPQARQKHEHYASMPISAVQSLFQASISIRKELSKIQTPTLLMHSRNDRTSHYLSSLSIANNISGICVLHTLYKSNHIITLDYEKNYVQSVTLNWIRDYCAEHFFI